MPTASPMAMMGPIRGETSIAPMMTAVELTLSPNDAIKMAHDFYDVMHTQPLGDMVESVAAYCRRKGGTL